MSTYLRANHTIQGSHINAQTLPAHDASIRFNCAYDRMRITFDFDKSAIITELPEQFIEDCETVGEKEFYYVAGKLAAMTAQIKAEMAWEFGKMVFRTTKHDLDEFEAQRKAKMPAGCSRELCEDCQARHDCDNVDVYYAADIDAAHFD